MSLDARKAALDKFEFMMGPDRGKLAVAMDALTDAMVLVGQHGVYCVSARNPSKPALDLETVMNELKDAKELVQRVMETLAAPRE